MASETRDPSAGDVFVFPIERIEKYGALQIGAAWRTALKTTRPAHDDTSILAAVDALTEHLSEAAQRMLEPFGRGGPG